MTKLNTCVTGYEILNLTKEQVNFLYSLFCIISHRDLRNLKLISLFDDMDKKRRHEKNIWFEMTSTDLTNNRLLGIATLTPDPEISWDDWKIGTCAIIESNYSDNTHRAFKDKSGSCVIVGGDKLWAWQFTENHPEWTIATIEDNIEF